MQLSVVGIRDGEQIECGNLVMNYRFGEGISAWEVNISINTNETIGRKAGLCSLSSPF